MHIRTTAIVLLAAAALAGCSSSSIHKATPPVATTTATAPTTTSSPTTDDRAALLAAVMAYSTAYFKPDPAAGYALLSARCKASISRSEYAGLLSAAVAQYGHQEVAGVTVDQLSGGLARVSYTYSVPGLDQHRQPWAREGGAWKYDGC